jgi:hypothetical protein
MRWKGYKYEYLFSGPSQEDLNKILELEMQNMLAYRPTRKKDCIVTLSTGLTRYKFPTWEVIFEEKTMKVGSETPIVHFRAGLKLMLLKGSILFSQGD